MTGEAFFAELLRGRVEFAEIHVGENFRFGHNRAGDVDLLRALGAGRGFRVIGIPRVQLQGDVVSSSAIRRAVESGDVDRARRMLGRPFEMTGEIVQGEGRGRSLDFPTANLESENELPPQRGVYVTEAVVLSARYGAVTNVGVRPTFGGQRLTIESHLLDVDEEMVGERMDLRFLARLRDEKRFANATELADQIARDRAAAIAFFRNSEMFTR
jgi:riboflavin kinase/FMN adenylyltransferase